MIIGLSGVQFRELYYYMRNFCNLIGLDQWVFQLDRDMVSGYHAFDSRQLTIIWVSIVKLNTGFKL